MAEIRKTFKEAVELTPDITNCYQNGLRALSANSRKISLNNTSECSGSLDIDVCVRHKYPNDNRWDYCFAYREEVFFMEVHPASTSDVDTVIRKLSWLKNWLKTQAPEIEKLKATSRNPYYWVQTGNMTILPNSRQARLIAEAGIKPISILSLI